MPFVPTGKKSKLKAQKARQGVPYEAVVDDAVQDVRRVMPGRGLCLPMCVLLQRVLAERLPHQPFRLRLGALTILPRSPTAGIGPIVLDPRGPEGIDAGFHAWLEDRHNGVLDPSILVTLAAEGYSVNPGSYLLGGPRKVAYGPLNLNYEEVSDLELRGLVESESALLTQMKWVNEGLPEVRPSVPIDIYLDVGWRPGAARRARTIGDAVGEHPQRVQIFRVFQMLHTFMNRWDVNGGCHLLSMMANVLLSEFGVPSALRVGLVKGPLGTFSHSWVEIDGKPFDLAISRPNLHRSDWGCPAVINGLEFATGRPTRLTYGVPGMLDPEAEMIATGTISNWADRAPDPDWPWTRIVELGVELALPLSREALRSRHGDRQWSRA